jgi:hypothetical protein
VHGHALVRHHLDLGLLDHLAGLGHNANSSEEKSGNLNSPDTVVLRTCSIILLDRKNQGFFSSNFKNHMR